MAKASAAGGPNGIYDLLPYVALGRLGKMPAAIEACSPISARLGWETTTSKPSSGRRFMLGGGPTESIINSGMQLRDNRTIFRSLALMSIGLYADDTQVYRSCRPSAIAAFSVQLSQCLDAVAM